MSYKDEIIRQINRLYFDSIEEFREAEARIALDSSFRKIFGKKNYSANIELLKKCKKIANEIEFPEDRIPDDDVDSQQIVNQGKAGIRAFNRLCDSYISMQTMLNRKAEGEKVSYKEYRQVFNETKERHNEMNDVLRELDIIYADYTEEEDLSSDTSYLTYDMIVGSDNDK